MKKIVVVFILSFIGWSCQEVEEPEVFHELVTIGLSFDKFVPEVTIVPMGRTANEIGWVHQLSNLYVSGRIFKESDQLVFMNLGSIRYNELPTLEIELQKGEEYRIEIYDNSLDSNGLTFEAESGVFTALDGLTVDMKCTTNKSLILVSKENHSTTVLPTFVNNGYTHNMTEHGDYYYVYTLVGDHGNPVTVYDLNDAPIELEVNNKQAETIYLIELTNTGAIRMSFDYVSTFDTVINVEL